MSSKAFFHYFLATTLCLALALSIKSPVYASFEPSKVSRNSNYAGLMAQAQASGSVRVIVMLNVPFQPEGKLSTSAALIDQRETIEQSQADLLSHLSGFDAALIKRFGTIPGMALSVNAEGLAQLAADSSVVSVEPDRLAAPDLAESVPLIGAAAAQAAGYTGAGQVVAVLDTGVDKNHPFLNGRVVSEACYSSTDSGYSSMSICPSGASQSVSAGSALPYATGVCPAGKCDHGTHVAGIIAGNGTTTYNHNGVAPGAQLIAIQVFSRFNTPANCSSSGAPCVMSFESDQILGLERVYALHTTYAIAAVNMSLGGDRYTSQAACDAANQDIKAVIDNLRSVGIATVIASGNSGYTDSLSSPACISSAISVGSIGDGSPGASTPLDTPCVYSNSAPFLNFLAPGDLIDSSIPNNSYANMRGTSMAAPHVAGAWALVKSRYPSYSVSQVSALLASSGKPITDTRNNVTTPRIKLDVILSGTYSISGQVVLGSGGSAGITVSDGAGHTAVTDAKGNYQIDGLPAGSYTITPANGDYTFTPSSQIVEVGKSNVVSQSMVGVNFSSIQIAFTLAGKVTDGAHGISGVTVNDGSGLTTTTGSDGSYAFHHLSPGAYTITPAKDGFTLDPPNLSVTLGAADQSVEDFKAVMLLYSVSGQVTLAGHGLADVTLYDGSGQTTITDASGNFTLSGVPYGTYTLTPAKQAHAFSPASIEIQVGSDLSGIAFVAVPLSFYYFPTIQFVASP